VEAVASGHHGYQRACDFFSGQASMCHLGQQNPQVDLDRANALNTIAASLNSCV
jgi:hypothetical protein